MAKREVHPNILATLKEHSFKKGDSENGRRGGLASAAANAKRREMREILDQLLRLPMRKKDGTIMQSVLTGKDMTVDEAVITAMIKSAVAGDIRAMRTIIELLGELVNRHEVDVTQSDVPTWDDIRNQIVSLNESIKNAQEK